MPIETKKVTSQYRDGSPAQILAETSELARLIFGSIQDARDFAVRYEKMNESETVLTGLQGFKSPGFECDAYSTQHNTTQHNALLL